MIRKMKGGDDLVMNFNKRGLSGVVTTVIIILLVLAAVAIIWAAIRPAIQGGAEQIGSQTQCLNLELEVTGCDSSAETVTIRRGTGGSNMVLDGIRIATTNGVYDETDAANIPEALGSEQITTADLGLVAGDNTFTVGGIQEDGGLCEAVENPQVITCA